jgi:hypothetical protein
LHCEDPSEDLLDFGFGPLEFRIVSIIAAIILPHPTTVGGTMV